MKRWPTGRAAHLESSWDTDSEMLCGESSRALRLLSDLSCSVPKDKPLCVCLSSSGCFSDSSAAA